MSEQNPDNITVIEPLLKASDVAKTLNISRTEAYRLMRSEIPVVRFGGATVRVRACDLQQFIEASLMVGDHAS